MLPLTSGFLGQLFHQYGTSLAVFGTNWARWRTLWFGANNVMEWTHGFSVCMRLGSRWFDSLFWNCPSPHLSANESFLTSNGKHVWGWASKDGAKRGARVARRKTRQEVEELMQRCIDAKIADITELKQLCSSKARCLLLLIVVVFPSVCATVRLPITILMQSYTVILWTYLNHKRRIWSKEFEWVWWCLADIF